MEQLDEFIALSRKRLEVILARLQMTEENISPQPQITQPGKKDEPPLPPSWPAQHQVSISEAQLRNLVGDPKVQLPKRFSDLLVNFTRDQRLLLYEYVTTCSGKCSEPEAPMPLLHEGQLSFAEIVAQKNQEKKKKRKYRKSRPTQIEEVRALVDLQMQALQQYWQEDEGTPERRHDRRKRSRSCSRSRDERMGRASENERRHERSKKYHHRNPSPRHSSYRDETYRGRSPRRDLNHSSRRKRSTSRPRRVSKSPSPTKGKRGSPSPRRSAASSRQRRHSSSPERSRHKKSKHKRKSKHKKRSPSRSSHKARK